MSYESKDKMVSHPSHYQSGKYEVIDIIDEFTKDLSGTEAICTGNAIKYILRWKKKNGRQDVEKAIWYLQHLVDYLVDQETVKEPLDKDIDLKNDETLYSMHQEEESDEHCRTCKFRFETPENNEVCKNCFGRERYICDEALLATDEKKEEPSVEENCAHCENFNPGPNGIIGCCPHSIYSDGCVHKDCVCSNFKKKATYSKEFVVEALKNWKPKLEPGCDKCEISECKFLEDPFMNPPYNELWDKWNAQKEIIKKLMSEKKEMQDSIDILEDDKKILKKCNGDLINANDDLLDKLYKVNKENYDLKKKILKRDLKIKEMQDNIYLLEDDKNKGGN